MAPLGRPTAENSSLGKAAGLARPSGRGVGWRRYRAAECSSSLAVQLRIVGINVLAGRRFIVKTNSVGYALYPFSAGPEAVKVEAASKAASKSRGIASFPQIPAKDPIILSLLMRVNCHALIVTDLPLTVTPAPGQLGSGYLRTDLVARRASSIAFRAMCSTSSTTEHNCSRTIARRLIDSSLAVRITSATSLLTNERLSMINSLRLKPR